MAIGLIRSGGSTAATVRYQRAKLRVLEQELENLVSENKQKVCRPTSLHCFWSG